MSGRPLSEWASIAEIVASIAVVVSLVFVGMQVRENTAELRAAQSNDLYDAIREVELTVLSNPGLMGAVDKATSGRRDELSGEEVFYFRNYLVQSYTIWEQAYSRANDGLMSADYYKDWEESFIVYLRHGMTKDDLDYVLQWLDADFAARVYSIVEELPNEGLR